MQREGKAVGAATLPELSRGAEPPEWATEDLGGPAQQIEALATARRCANLRCSNLAGSDAELPSKACAGCQTARYCSLACSHADWRQHKPLCRQLAAQKKAKASAAQPAATGS